MVNSESWRGESNRAARLPLLTIAVPTWNRGEKLSRLLVLLEQELREHSLLAQVGIFVASNASTDCTVKILANPIGNLKITWHQHAKNIGFDANLLFLYKNVTTPYLWFFGDDDIPIKGAIATVCSALLAHNPDAILCPFAQSSDGRYVRPFPEKYRIIGARRFAITTFEKYQNFTSTLCQTTALSF